MVLSSLACCHGGLWLLDLRLVASGSSVSRGRGLCSCGWILCWWEVLIVLSFPLSVSRVLINVDAVESGQSRRKTSRSCKTKKATIIPWGTASLACLTKKNNYHQVWLFFTILIVVYYRRQYWWLFDNKSHSNCSKKCIYSIGKYSRMYHNMKDLGPMAMSIGTCIIWRTYQ